MVNVKKVRLGVILIANKLKLDNLVILIDYNKIQALTTLNDGLPLTNLKTKIKILQFKCG